MASLALASLTENYTDSEGEEHPKDESTTPRDIEMSPEKPETPPTSDVSNRAPTPAKVSNLVSYHDQDETVISDDEEGKIPQLKPQSPEDEKDDIELPPEPLGRCSNELQDRIKKRYEDMVAKGTDINIKIQNRKDFRNPSIYEKLIQFCGISELGTNYSPEIYDPFKWGKNSYYDELARVQKIEMDKREKERREKTKVEVIVGTAKKVAAAISLSEEDKKRKSKWDQIAQSGGGKTAGLPLTTSATGTKGTVISAFGSLNKKPRL